MEEFLNKIKENFINTDVEFETINIKVDSSQWVETHQKLKEEFDLKLREIKNGKKTLVAKLVEVDGDEILFHCGEEKMSLNFLDLDLCRLKPDFEELMRVNK